MHTVWKLQILDMKSLKTSWENWPLGKSSWKTYLRGNSNQPHVTHRTSKFSQHWSENWFDTSKSLLVTTVGNPMANGCFGLGYRSPTFKVSDQESCGTKKKKSRKLEENLIFKSSPQNKIWSKSCGTIPSHSSHRSWKFLQVGPPAHC